MPGKRNIAVTQSCYIKALTESQVSVVDLLGEEFESGSVNWFFPFFSFRFWD